MVWIGLLNVWYRSAISYEHRCAVPSFECNLYGLLRCIHIVDFLIRWQHRLRLWCLRHFCAFLMPSLSIIGLDQTWRPSSRWPFYLSSSSYYSLVLIAYRWCHSAPCVARLRYSCSTHHQTTDYSLQNSLLLNRWANWSSFATSDHACRRPDPNQS